MNQTVNNNQKCPCFFCFKEDAGNELGESNILVCDSCLISSQKMMAIVPLSNMRGDMTMGEAYRARAESSEYGFAWTDFEGVRMLAERSSELSKYLEKPKSPVDFMDLFYRLRYVPCNKDAFYDLVGEITQ